MGLQINEASSLGFLLEEAETWILRFGVEWYHIHMASAQP